MNAYHNFVKASPDLKVRKPGLKLTSANNLDLAKKLGRTMFFDSANFA